MRSTVVALMITLCTLTLSAQWQPVGMNRGNVIGFAETDEGVFCAVRGAGVYRATDTSFQWTEFREGLTDVDLLSITDDGTGGLLLITANGLWHKIPNAPWFRVADPVFTGATLRFIKRVSKTDIYLGGRDNRCFRSLDNGNTWQEVGRITTLTNREATDFAISPDGVVWAVCGDLFSSSDRGETWQSSNYSAQTGQWANAIYIGKKMTIVVGTRASYSTDNRTTWKEVGNSSRHGQLNSIVEHNDQFFIGGAQYIITIPPGIPSMTIGSSFQFSGYSSAKVERLFITSKLVILAGINMHGVFTYTLPFFNHPTAVWKIRSNGINGVRVGRFGVAPRGALFLTDEDGDLYRILPGEDARMISSGGYTGFTGIVQKHRDGRMIFAFHHSPPRGKDMDLLYYSDDDGRTSQRLSQAFLPGTEDRYGTADWASSVGMMESNSDSVLLGFPGSSMYGSHIASKQITDLKIGSKINTYRIWCGTDYIVGGDPINYFDASDSTWRASMYEGLKVDLGSMARSESGAFYAASSAGLLKSLDNAKTFFKLTPQFDGLRLNELVVINDLQLVVADSNDIYATNDGGSSWRRINRNLPPSKIIAIDTDFDRNLYVAFRGAGVWSCPWDEATTHMHEDAVDVPFVKILHAHYDERQEHIEVKLRSHSFETVSIAVFDVRGNKHAEQLVNGSTSHDAITFSSQSLSSGAYYVVARSNGTISTMPVTVVR